MLGASSVPDAGSDFVAVETESVARRLADERSQKSRTRELAEKGGVASMGGLTLEKFSEMQADSDLKELPLVVKGDVHGSVEAVAQSLEQLANEEVRINIIHKGVGGVTENDIQLAFASNAIVVGFNVRADVNAAQLAEADSVEIIYSRE